MTAVAGRSPDSSHSQVKQVSCLTMATIDRIRRRHLFHEETWMVPQISLDTKSYIQYHPCLDSANLIKLRGDEDVRDMTSTSKFDFVCVANLDLSRSL